MKITVNTYDGGVYDASQGVAEGLSGWRLEYNYVNLASRMQYFAIAEFLINSAKGGDIALTVVAQAPLSERDEWHSAFETFVADFVATPNCVQCQLLLAYVSECAITLRLDARPVWAMVNCLDRPLLRIQNRLVAFPSGAADEPGGAPPF